MIIIKIIILYFIQIRHNDDFPSTGTRLVIYNASFCTVHRVGYEIVFPHCCLSSEDIPIR